MSIHARRPVQLISLRLSPLSLARPQFSPTKKPISSPTDLRILLNVTSPLPSRRRNAPPPPLDLQPPTPPAKNSDTNMFVVTPRTPQTGRQTPRTPRSAPSTPMGSHHLKSPRTPTTSLIRDSIRARREKLNGMSLKSPIGFAAAVNSPTHIPVNKANNVEGVAGFHYIFPHQKEKELVISKPVVRPAQAAPPLNLGELGNLEALDPRSPGLPRGRGVGPMGGLGMDMGVKGPETPFLRPPPSPWANAMI